jgi:hypothetical protein
VKLIPTSVLGYFVFLVQLHVNMTYKVRLVGYVLVLDE